MAEAGNPFAPLSDQADDLDMMAALAEALYPELAALAAKGGAAARTHPDPLALVLTVHAHFRSLRPFYGATIPAVPDLRALRDVDIDYRKDLCQEYTCARAQRDQRAAPQRL